MGRERSWGARRKADRMAIMVKPSKTRKSAFKPEPPQGGADFSEEMENAAEPALNLADHFLIAMPSMLDPVFGGTLVYLCEHNAGGALGLIVNKPTDMSMGVLFERIELKRAPGQENPRIDNQTVMFGGPVQVERGFVLHSPHGQFSSTLQVSEDVGLTTSKDVLEAAAIGRGPERMLVTLGCSGWSAGQLEEEIVRNGWLTVRADPSIMFDVPAERRFAAAMALLGIDPAMLAGVAGHA